jgi:hypothetical protein
MAKSPKFSRRSFLKRSASVVTAGIAGKTLLSPGTAKAAPLDPSRVVVVSDPQVWLGGDTTNDEIDASRAANMVAAGLKRVAGVTDIAEAMRALVPDTPAYDQARMAIKINHISGYLPTHYSVVRPLFDALVAIGFNPSNITAYDTRSLKANGGPFSGNIGFAEYNQSGNSDANWGGSASIAGRTVRWPLTLYNADWMINVAVYKDHGGPRVTLCCKNHLGSINKGYAGFPCAGTQLAPLNAHAQLSPHWIPGMGGKCVLNVIDAVYGSIEGDNPGNPVDCTPQRIYFSCDPINIDHVGWEDMNNIEGVYQGEPPHLDEGVSLGVGVRDSGKVLRYEMGAVPTRTEVDARIQEHKASSASDDDVKDTIDRYRQGD